jgi:hypothetical protein
MAGRRLAECNEIDGATDGAELVNGLEDISRFRSRLRRLNMGAAPFELGY